MTSKEADAVMVEMRLRGDQFEPYYSLLVYRDDLYTSYSDALEAKAVARMDAVQGCDGLDDLHEVVWGIARLHSHDLICLVESGNEYVLPYYEAIELIDDGC